MRTALRTVMAVALAVPLIAPAMPASASSTFLYREKGSFADAFFEGEGTPGGLPGNYSFGWVGFHSSDLADGFVETFDCEEGQTPWESESGCDSTGSYQVWGDDFTVVSGKGKGAPTTYSGTVDLYDATTQDFELAAGQVPFTITLTPTGATSRSTYTDSFRDPESGITYRSRETRVYTYATVQGDLDGVPAVDGSVGTYSSRGMERIA